MDIAQQARQQHAQHVVAATIAATIHTHPTPIPTRHPFQQEAVQAAEVVAHPEDQSPVGHEQVHLFIIHLLKCRLLRPSVRHSRSSRHAPSFETFFFVMPGTIGRVLLKS
jgi:hypothetical protein